MEQQPTGRGGEKGELQRIQHFQFGPWLFNVNAAQAIIAKHPRTASALPVEPWVRFYGLDTPDDAVSLFSVQHLDRDYAMTTNLDEPLLVATVRSNDGEEYPLLIDGTHRLYRAFTEHRADLPAYVLTVEESFAIREDGFIGASVYWPSHDARRQSGGATELGDG